MVNPNPIRLAICSGSTLKPVIMVTGATSEFIHFVFPGIAIASLLGIRERDQLGTTSLRRFSLLFRMVVPFLAGFVLPLLAFALFYYWHHALGPLIDGIFVAPFHRLLQARLSVPRERWELLSLLVVLVLLALSFTRNRMLEWFRRIHGLRYAVLRYFNAAGAWEGHAERHDPESHLIPNVLRSALGSSGAVHIFGTDYPTPDGTCVRDYIHIYDLAQAHLLVLRALEDSGQRIYNLGSGTGFSIREVITAARRVTGREVPFVESRRRPGDPPTLVASSEKIRRELHWVPKYAHLDDILSSAWLALK